MSTSALMQAMEILSRESRCGDGIVQNKAGSKTGSPYLVVNGKPLGSEDEHQLYASAFNELRKQELFFGPALTAEGELYRRATEEEYESLLIDLESGN